MSILKKYKNYLLPIVVLSLLLIGGLIIIEADLYGLIRGIPRGVELIGHMIPPEYEVIPELIVATIETIQIAFVGTVFGVILSLFISIFAANNLNPNPIIRNMARVILSAERALPDLIVILLFVAIVGLGSFPGVMALAISSTGMLGKLYADSIEEIDPKPMEALEAVGATKLQIIRFVVLPQFIPSFIANTLYRFDLNIRLSVLLGAVGAGGIGFYLVVHMRLMNYGEALSAIIVIIIMIIACEKISDYMRKGIFGQEVLK